MKRRILSLLLALCLIVGLLPSVAIPHAHAETTPVSATVTLFGTAVTIDNDETTTNIPEAYYWADAVAGEDGVVPAPQAVTAEDAWNYSYTIVEGVPTVSIQNANYAYAARFLLVESAFAYDIEVVYYGANTISLPVKNENASKNKEFIKYEYSGQNEKTVSLSLIGKDVGDAKAELTVPNINKDTQIITMKKVPLIIRGGKVTFNKTTGTQVQGVILNNYGSLLIEDCTLSVTSKSNSASSYAYYPAVSAEPITIRNSNVTINTAHKLALASGVFLVKDSKGVLDPQSIQDPATLTIENSTLKVTNPTMHKNFAGNKYAAAIYAKNLVVKDSTIEAKSKEVALKVTSTAENALAMNGFYNWFTEDGSIVAEYDFTAAYFKVAPCDHTNTTTNEEIITNATCNDAGSKKVTVTCECGKVISEEIVAIAALGHTEADAVVENFVDSDMNNKGSYDSVVYCSVCKTELKRENIIIDEKTGAVASVNGTKYATLDEAIKAANALTGEVTIEILGKAEYTNASPNLGSSTCTAIHFVGKTADAEFSLLRNGSNGYVSGTNAVAVTYKDLILSKPEGGYAADAGFRNIGFCTFYVGSVSYTNCIFANGAVASGSKTTYTGCTFKATHDRYGMFAYGNADVTVEDCVFDALRGIKLWAEGLLKDTALTVKNSDFSKLTQKPAVVLTSGESVTLEGNTYSATGVFELDLDGVPNGTPVTSTDPIICVNDNGACGVLVDGKIYTTVAQAAAVATEGSTVTLLHESAETVELPEGVTLDKNGFTAVGVTVRQPKNYVAEVNGVKYEDLQEAIIAAAPNGTVELLCDVTVDKWIMISETLTIGDGTIITLEMNGLTIDGNGNTLTINDVESAANGNHIFYDGDYNVCDLTIVMGDNVNGLGITSGIISNVTFSGGRGASGGAAVHVSDGLTTGVHAGNVTIEGCTFKNNGGAIYSETAQNGLVVNNNTFEIASGANVILLRGTEQFTNNTVVSGRTVNVVSGSPVVSGNDFGNVRLKVYNEATATIANNTINNLVFNDDTKTQATFENNTLSESAQAALETVTKSYVAEVDGVKYEKLEDALKAVQANSVVEILDDITIDTYWDARYTGGKFTVPVTINGNGHTIKFTNTVYDAGNHYSVFRFEKDAVVTNLTIDMSKALSGFNGRFRAISAKADLTVAGCTFIGNGSANNTRAVIFGEGAGAAVGEVDVEITNSTFIGWRRAISDNENAQDAKALTITGNTFKDASVNVSAAESIVFNGNTMEDSWAKLVTYTAADTMIVTAQNNNLEANDVASGNYNYTNAANVTAQPDFLTPVAKVGTSVYTSLEEAFAAAPEGATITLLADAAPVLKSQCAITKAAVIDLGGKTLTLTEDDLYFGTTTFKNGTIVVDPSVKPSTAVFWMFANQTLTFDAVKLVATGVTGTYLIGLDGNNSDLNLINGSEILVENTTALDLDIICVNASTGNDIKIENSKVNVTNLDGRVFFRGNYTISGNSDIDLAGITKAGFRIEAGQTLTIADTATVDIVGEPRDGGIHLTDVTATYIKADTATVNATINKPIIYVAQIGEQKFENLTDAIAVVQPGQTITLIGDVTLTETLTLPAGITLNGNGKTITGEVWAEGNLTFQGHTKVTNFNAGYNKPVITIGEGACLELIGTGRMVIGHGATFNITGSIADAKTADKATIQPSLIMPGASFTGAGVTFNVTNAYIKATAYCSSKNSSANGTFNFNITNSIWDQTNTLVFSEPTSGKDPVVNFNLKDSVLTSTSHLVFSVTKGEIVFDNSNVNVGSYKQLENRSNLTIKNGSVVYASVQTSSNAKNPGTTTVDNATYVTTGTFGGSDLGIGKLILKNNASFTTGTLAKVDVAIDASSEFVFTKIDAANTTVALGAGASIVAPEGLTVTTVDGYIVEYVNGAYVSKKANYVAQIGEQKFESVAAALAYAKEAGLTDVTIVLIGETDASTTDSFDLVYTQLFDSVTFKQEDASKVYYLYDLYTGSRTNGGKFIFDGVNLIVTDQYMFEGNVVLTNNSYIASVAEANCFIYNGETTIEPGSVLKGVIEDFRAGDMIVDGGKTDGSYNTVPGFQDAILDVEWSGDKLILKNGAYVKINAANEVGRLTLSAGTAAELYASKLDVWQYIDVASGAEFYMDLASLVTTQKITGAGKIIVNVAGIGDAVQVIKADMSGFTGTIELVGGKAAYQITATGLVVEKALSGSGTEADPYLITDLDDLILFRDSVNAGETKYNAPGVYVALGADIDMAGATWERGIGDGINATFDGIFDGKNFTIKNLNFAPKADSDGYLCGGLFGYTFGAAVIKNLTLENITVTATEAGHNVGVLVGFANNNGGKLNVSNVTVKNVTIDAPKAFGVGVIVGYSYRAMGTIENCSVEGANITGYSFVGGITGYSYSDAVITGCSVNNATITATSKGAGGIAGLALNGNEIFANTVSNTTVTAPTNWGYVVGELGASSAIIYNNNAAEPQLGGDYGTGEAYVAKIGDKYYTTLEAAIKVGGEVELLADIEASDVILLDKSITINGNGHKVISSATRVFRVTTSGVEITLNDVNMVSNAVVVYPNDIRGISVDTYLTNVKLTLNNCSVDFTDASACDWAYAVNVSGNGTGHTVTVNGGTYEGANVINVHGAKNTIIVKDATLTSLYPNADVYYGAIIWVLQNQGSTVTATGNTYNGANTVVYNLGTGTTLDQSNNTDNTTRVVAKIGNTYYTTLADAFAAGGEVKLLQNIVLTESVVVPAGKTVILDLNGKTVSMADASGASAALLINKGTLTINDSVGGGKLTFNTTTPSASNAYASNTISNYGILTINGGIIENTSIGGGACYALDNYAGSTATINGGKLTAAKTTVRVFNWTNGDAAKATLTVNGGEILSENSYGINLNLGNAPAVELTINGGTITTNDTVYNLGVYIANKGSAENLVVNVTGGTINGRFALNGVTCTTMAKDAVSISGGTMDGIVCYDVPAYGFVSGGTFKAPVEKEFCIEGYQPKDNGDGTYGVVEHTCFFEAETIDATCIKDGKIVYTCSCGDSYEVVIPATGEHVFDNAGDTTCNNCDYVRVVEPIFELDENNKLVVVDPNADHIYHRVTVYFLGDKTVEDITLTNPLKAIDPNAKTYWTLAEINMVELLKSGNYVVHLNYNTAGSPKYTVAKAFTVVGAETAPTIEVENGKITVTDENSNNIYHRVTVYYLGGETVSNIYDVDALKTIDPTAKTYWGLREINKILMTASGNYVAVLDYNNPGSSKITVAKAFSVATSKPTISRDGYTLKVTDKDATHKYHRATVYFIGSETVDIYDEAALKAIDATAKTYWDLDSINKVQLANPGTYVIYLSYNLASGVKQTVVVKTTTRMPVPSVWLEENGQIGTYVPVEVAHRNYEIYYLGDQTVEDIYDIDALKAIDADPIKFDNQKQIAERGMLNEKGNYVLVMYYNYAGSARQVVAEFATLK